MYGAELVVGRELVGFALEIIEHADSQGSWCDGITLQLCDAAMMSLVGPSRYHVAHGGDGFVVSRIQRNGGGGVAN